MTRSIVVGTAGHIDHGKSSLVLALTGTDPDRLKEEKTRGITIDLGFAHAMVADINVAFVDVPGHERFVKNMLAGVGGIDAVLLVIAADESVMPQTREHFAICRLLQIPAGLIVLTKSDLVDAETLELARMEARELVAGSRLADAPILSVSSRTGEGLDALRRALGAMAAGLAERGGEGTPRLPVDRVFSMRGFGTVVTGTLTSGTIAVDDELILQPPGRRVKVRGLQVHGAPQQSASAGRRVAVNLGGVEVADASRGQTLTRPGAFEETRRFDALIELLPGAKPLRHGARVRFHQGATELLGRVALAAEVTENPKDAAADHTDTTDDAAADHADITEDAAADYADTTDDAAADHVDGTDDAAADHTDTTDDAAADHADNTDQVAPAPLAPAPSAPSALLAPAPLAPLAPSAPLAPRQSPPASELRPGARAFARIRLEAPAVLTRGDRFILRQYSPSMTIGGGRVLDPAPARSPIRNAAAGSRFARLNEDDESAALVFVEERRAAGIDLGALARRAGLTPRGAEAVGDRLARAGRVVNVKGTLFAASMVRDLETRLIAAVSDHHRTQPMSEGLPREEARERVFGRADARLFDAVLGELVAAGKLTGTDRLALPGRGVSLTPEESRARESLDRAFRDAGLAPPDLASAAAGAGVPAAVAERVSKLLLRQKTLVKLDTLLFHNEPLERLKQEVRALKGQGTAAKVDVAGFKERYGISRKYAIPLLEWLDRERVTRRMGDARVIL